MGEKTTILIMNYGSRARKFNIEERLGTSGFFSLFFYFASKWISPILEFRKKILEFRGKFLEFREKILSLGRKKLKKMSKPIFF